MSLLAFPTTNFDTSEMKSLSSEPLALKPELSLSDLAAVVENLLHRVIRSRPDALETVAHVLAEILKYESGKTLEDRCGHLPRPLRAGGDSQSRPDSA